MKSILVALVVALLVLFSTMSQAADMSFDDIKKFFDETSPLDSSQITAFQEILGTCITRKQGITDLTRDGYLTVIPGTNKGNFNIVFYPQLPTPKKLDITRLENNDWGNLFVNPPGADASFYYDYMGIRVGHGAAGDASAYWMLHEQAADFVIGESAGSSHLRELYCYFVVPPKQ